MFDRRFLESSLMEQINSMGPNIVRGHVRLLDGTEYRLRKIAAIDDAFFWIEAYPPEGLTEAARQVRTDPRGELHFDRIAILYSHLASVFLTVVPPDGPEEKIEMGFHAVRSS